MLPLVVLHDDMNGSKCRKMLKPKLDFVFRQEGSRLCPVPYANHNSEAQTNFQGQSAEAMSSSKIRYERWRRFDLFQESIYKPNWVVFTGQESSR